MNPIWYPVMANAVITVFCTGVIWGTLAQKVRDVKEQADKVEKATEWHTKQLTGHEGRISHMEGSRVNGVASGGPF